MKTEIVKVELNQPVVISRRWNSREHRVERGEVVKVARVWIEVLAEGSRSPLRFRLDTQTDGSEIGYPTRFYTVDQWAEKQRRDEADEFLRSQGIRLEYNSPWRGREVELAELLRAAAKPVEEQ